MDDSLRLVFPENFIEPSTIPNVALLERAPFGKFGVTVREVVIDDRRKAFAEQIETGVSSDIARATSNKNVCHLPVPHPDRSDYDL